MSAAIIEWFAKHLALETLKRWIFPDRWGEDREIESELYDAFVADYEVIDLTEPTGVDKLEGVPDDLQSQIVNLAVERVGSSAMTVVDISLEEDALNHLPPEEERVENAVNFWLEKDDVTVAFRKHSRVGPLLTIYIPSTRKADVKSGIEAVREILTRLIHSDNHLWGFVYELLEEGHSINQLLNENQEIKELREEIGDDEFKELIRYLAGSFSGHDPEIDVD